jgi:lipopolysaccharide heptosyltransferase II
VRPIHKILFITLSNIGDCILTLPVLDALKARYPHAQVTVFVGPRPKGLFEHNPAVHDVAVYDKHAPLSSKTKFVNDLFGRRYDMVVDLRSSLLGLLIPCAIRTWGGGGRSLHMKDRHVAKIAQLRIPSATVDQRVSFPVSIADKKAVTDILRKAGVVSDARIVLVAPGARSEIKRWPKEKFSSLVDTLTGSFALMPVLIGDQDDIPISSYIAQHSRCPIVDLTGKTTFSQTAALMQMCELLITNDSANLHLAGYFNVPVVAIFGPTDDVRYGPWSDKAVVVKKEIFCRPCCKAQCRFNTLACMEAIGVSDVGRAVSSVLAAAVQTPLTVSKAPGARPEYKRILIARTDRIGDLILSTPVFKALRLAYPNSYLAVMARPYTSAVIEGNPYVDEVILYDRKQFDSNFVKFLSFIGRIRKKRFDLAIVLHPTTRDHLIVFLSGIRRRIGYNRKMGFLLTDHIEHYKQEGKKHESDYALDVVKLLDIGVQEKEFFVSIDPRAQQWAREFFSKAGIKESDRVVVINPGASCPSKIWPAQRYAAVADALAAKGAKIILLAGPDGLDQNTARAVLGHMRTKAIDLIGKAPIPETASLFRRCSLVISADTGPMHIAAAVGAPVIAIFGRNQPGISPQRWGPVNANSFVLHKDVGCKECLAHDCKISFACLAAISVDDVLTAANRLLNSK